MLASAEVVPNRRCRGLASARRKPWFAVGGPAAYGVEQVSARSDGHERPPQGWPYARDVANASPSPTPNPDAMKFTLDVTLAETLDVPSPDAAVGVPFAEAVFAAGGVAAIFGVNDFITVRRQPGVQWDPIVAAVVAAAAAHL